MSSFYGGRKGVGFEIVGYSTYEALQTAQSNGTFTYGQYALITNPTSTQYGNLYKLDLDELTLIGNLAGPKGDIGPTGATIQIESITASVTTVTGAEMAVTGSIINTNNDLIKQLSLTFQNIQGPIGPTGPIGEQGNTGPTGTSWYSGDQIPFWAIDSEDLSQNIAREGISISGTHYILTSAYINNYNLGNYKLNDSYLNLDSGDFYQCISKTSSEQQWEYKGNLRGPIGATGVQGPTGDQGNIGPTGARGSTFIHESNNALPQWYGSVLPTGTSLPSGVTFNQENNGYIINAISTEDLQLYDFCINENGDIYQLIEELDNNSTQNWNFIVNIKGPQGAQGIQGITGSMGPTGETGQMGSRGLSGRDGEDGPTGPTGERGPVGPAGARGTKWFFNTYDGGAGTTYTIGPVESGTYAVGDYSINKNTGQVFQCTTVTGVYVPDYSGGTTLEYTYTFEPVTGAIFTGPTGAAAIINSVTASITNTAVSGPTVNTSFNSATQTLSFEFAGIATGLQGPTGEKGSSLIIAAGPTGPTGTYVNNDLWFKTVTKDITIDDNRNLNR